MSATYDRIPKSMRFFIIGLFLIGLLGSYQARAQQSPIAISYRIGQGSAGDSGPVAPTGAYISTVALDLPAPRGDLPVPLSVVYSGGNRAGAAGVGWSIPLSYVRRSVSLSHRKPAHLGPGSDNAAIPKPAPRLFVNLGTGPMLMSKTDTDGVYRPFIATTYIELVETETGWIAYDPAGRQYTFSQIAGAETDLGIPQHSPELGDENLWLLTKITDRTRKNWVSLRYDVFDMIPPPPHEIGGDFTIKELILSEIAYSPDLSGSCPKHRVKLHYRHVGSTAPHPAFLDVLVTEGRLRSRTRILNRIEVWAQSETSCEASAAELLRSYAFSYTNDLDTGKPRLNSVNLFGRGDDGTDQTTGLPVARYEYGTAISGEQLVYGAPRAIVLGEENTPPAGFYHVRQQGVLNTAFFLNMQYIRDLTGDNRPDYLRFLNIDEVLISANVPAESGAGLSTFPTATAYPADNLWDKALPLPHGEAMVSTEFGGLAMPFTVTWQQLIDWNGDGRPDIVNARKGKNPDGEASPDYWRVFINTPGPSGNPADINWLETHVDIGHIRAEIRKTHVLNPAVFPPGHAFNKDKYLPLEKTHSTHVLNADDGSLEEAGRITEWKLFDANGDSFPDFVFNRAPVSAFSGVRLENSGLISFADGPFDEPHHPVQIIDLVPNTNNIMVFYHTGPLMAGAGSALISQWAGPALNLREDGNCSVERFSWDQRHNQHMTCGYLELNGGGPVDHLVEEKRFINGEMRFQRLAIRSSGLPQQVDQELPENQTTWRFQEYGRAFLVPGPVNVVHSERAKTCPNATLYHTRQLSVARDITGDRIPDYVYHGTRTSVSTGAPLDYPGVELIDDRGEDPQWWVMVGTGTGFQLPRRIESPSDAPFEIHKSLAGCDGVDSVTIATLIDMDGDGRLDIVRSDGPHKIVVASLGNSTAGAGAHDSGRLIREANGYGAATLVSYGSAKVDHRTTHQLPFEEIVVTEVKAITEKQLGMSLEPVRYAYGDARLHYRPLLGRWVFPGYGRRVILQGLPEHGELVRGTATIFEAIRAAELPGGYQRHALINSTRDVNFWAGLFSADPNELLADVFTSQFFRWRGNRHIEYATKLPANQGSTGPVTVSLNEECYNLSALGPPPAIGDLKLCRRSGIAYQTEITDERGTIPYPSEKSVATRTTILPEDVDNYGRATLIELANDRSRSDDDVCVSISYASGSSGQSRVLDAVHTIRFHDCLKHSVIYSGVRNLYDNLPEGQVDKGFITGQIMERYDAWFAQKLEEYKLEARDYDDYGNVTRITLDRGDGITSVFETAFDVFGLVPETVVGSASDVSANLINSTQYDPVMLLPISHIDANGLNLRTYYDRFGRIEKTTVQQPDDPEEYVQIATEYFGDQGQDPQGRRIRERIFRKWVPAAMAFEGLDASTSAVTEVVAHYDELGRLRYQDTDLGPDYPDGSLISGFTEYDGLGRPIFAAAPFPSSDLPNTNAVYGTTYSYYPDGTLHCAIQGQGPQFGLVVPRTDESVGRYPTCFSYKFETHKAVVLSFGPNELLPGVSPSAFKNEAVYSAIGRMLSQSRWQQGKRLQYSKFDYDRLGQLSGVWRYAAPEFSDGLVLWRIRNDSLGQILSIEEPEVAVRSRQYDRWGNLTGLSWTDATVDPSVVRGIVHKYDGFGRLVSVDETEDGAPNPDLHVDYFYDQASSEADHLNPNNLMGRLSHTRDGVMNTYFGYDGLGRRISDTRVDHKNGDRYSTVSRLGPFGHLKRLTFLAADITPEPETVDYTYDSAGRVKGISKTDSTGSADLWTAKSIDPFGRYQEVELDNGIVLTSSYRPNLRREHIGTQIHSGSNLWSTQYKGYDGLMLLKSRTDQNTSSSDTLISLYKYDAINRLTETKTSAFSGVIGLHEEYRYDGIGNLISVEDHTGSSDLILIPDIGDPDRICRAVSPKVDSSLPFPEGDFAPRHPSWPPRIEMPSFRVPISYAYGQMEEKARDDSILSAVCNYRYDAVGNVTQIIGGPLGDRTFEYDGWSRIVAMHNDTATAATRYDAFGKVAERMVTGVSIGKNRIDQHYGDLVEKTTFLDSNGQPTTIDDGSAFGSYVDRFIPGPSGIIALLRRTDAGENITLYPHGDFTATRLVTQEDGQEIQSVAYRPYGEIIDDTGTDSPLTYLKYLWNGGDTFKSFGVSHLGFRLYESHTGRFLQRDPLLIVRSSSQMNPYAFALNDPVNFTDPSGLDSGNAGCDSLNPACSGGNTFGGFGGDINIFSTAVGHANLRIWQTLEAGFGTATAEFMFKYTSGPFREEKGLLRKAGDIAYWVVEPGVDAFMTFNDAFWDTVNLGIEGVDWIETGLCGHAGCTSYALPGFGHLFGQAKAGVHWIAMLNRTAATEGRLAVTARTLATSAPARNRRVLQNQAVGNSFDDYVAATKLSKLDEVGQLGRQQKLPTPDVPGRQYIKPDYTIFDRSGYVAAFGDAKSGTIAFDAQARGLVQWSTVTKSKTLIYYVPRPTAVPRSLIQYGRDHGVSIRVIVVN